MSNNSKQKTKGFTLIELLVVIAIIGVLATIILSSLNAARAKARDARRMQSVHQLQLALELYFQTNGKYPGSTTCGATVPNMSWCNSVESLSGGRWIKDNGVANVLAPYIGVEPLDPLQGATANWTPVGGGAIYYYSNSLAANDGKSYMIVYGLENTGSPLQLRDGITVCDLIYRDYGTGSNGVITTGVNCPL